MQQLTKRKKKKMKMMFIHKQIDDEMRNAEEEEEEEEVLDTPVLVATDDAVVNPTTQCVVPDNEDEKPSLDEDEDEDDNGAAAATIVDSEMPLLSWSCCYCVKEFDNRWSLARHEKIHTGEKPYKCHICDKEFIQKCSLRRHVKIHSEEKPFVCTHLNCGKRFKLKEYLDMHRRVHLTSSETAEEDYDRRQSLSNLMGNNNSTTSNADRALIHQLHFRMYRMSIVYGEQLSQYQMKEQQLVLALHECSAAFGAVVSELIALRGLDNIPIDILLMARRFCPHLGL